MEAAAKSSDEVKIGVQKPIKFSIDSLLAADETQQLDDVECNVINVPGQCEKADCSALYQKKNYREECLKKEDEVVSTTEGYYQKRCSEGRPRLLCSNSTSFVSPLP